MKKWPNLLEPLTYTMEQSPSSEANWFSASQESPSILWNLKVIYHIPKCPPSVLILSQINQSMPSHPTSGSSILILSSYPCLGLPSGFFPSGFPTKTLYTPLLSLYVLHTQPTSLSSSLCSFLHSPITSSLLGPNILLSTLFSNTLID